MSKHRQDGSFGFGRFWRTIASAIPLFVIVATLIVIPPVASAQTAPPAATGATSAGGATGATGAPTTPPPAPTGATGAAGPTGTTGAPVTPAPAGPTGSTTTPPPVDTTYTPTLTSDKPEYRAGDPVTLTGAGFKPGETVHVHVREDNPTVTWSWNDDPIADENGGFVVTFNLPD